VSNARACFFTAGFRAAQHIQGAASRIMRDTFVFLEDTDIHI
jgi:hypothetical protein